MATGRLLLIGAGNVGRHLLTTLGTDFDILVLDRDSAALEEGGRLRPGIKTVCGDATSRLQLEDLDPGSFEAVIVATSSERVNIEVVRLLRLEFDHPQVIALGITPEGIRAMTEMGAEVEDLFRVSAAGIRNRLEERTRTAIGIGIGQNEIIEVEVHPDSRLIGKRLSMFRPGNWRIGILYRDDRIIVPHGSTVLKAKDRVVLLGDPRTIRTLADRLAFRFTDFPLEFGNTLVLWMPATPAPDYLEEVSYLVGLLPLRHALIIGPDPETLTARVPDLASRGLENIEHHPLDRIDADAILTLLAERHQRPGMLVAPRSRLLSTGMPLMRGLRQRHNLINLGETLACPLLLAAGTAPYESLALAGLRPEILERKLETALELAALASSEVRVLTVTLSPYLSDREEQEVLDSLPKTAHYLSRIYRHPIQLIQLEGNPVHAITACQPDARLFISDQSAWSRTGFLRGLLSPDVEWELVRRCPISCLLIPPLAVFDA
ncbi:MAG: hypothetical protein Tsb0017_12350 [Geothermobacteraceae bacterium]